MLCKFSHSLFERFKYDFNNVSEINHCNNSTQVEKDNVMNIYFFLLTTYI